MTEEKVEIQFVSSFLPSFYSCLSRQQCQVEGEQPADGGGVEGPLVERQARQPPASSRVKS